MADLVKLCLRIAYAYGRFTGVINFKIDLKTGQPLVTRRATLISVSTHLLIFALLLYHTLRKSVVTVMWKYANSLHEYVFLVIAGFRVVCVFLALVSRWSQRRTFMELFNSFWRLYQRNPRIIQYCRRSIVSKLFCVTITETLQVIVTLAMMRNRLSIALALRIWAILSLTAIINVIITQYFVATACVRGRYALLNKDLQAIVHESQSLVPNGSGVFVTRCCYLADRLERIAKSQSDLQELIENLSTAYDGEVICLVITYYLNMLGTSYLLFIISKHGSLGNNLPMVITLCGIAYFGFYVFDCWLHAFNVFYLLDAHDKMVKMLNKRTLFQPGLDHRLEMVFESFALNLVRNPLKLKIYGLFEFGRGTSFAVGNSLLTHSLLLIQYDVQNF
ncbi:putative gustatory receptor 59d [Drosophila sechellia]|uniref:Gustatory receptor n=1 Tax=Drosophila sechellia TaxID=7238 RepID=B4I8H1_DROSE|nr:putative gustatory receptor 59d [Drosophila sechellia]EDW56896.1 GM15580 [Drosophila sechellia]